MLFKRPTFSTKMKIDIKNQRTWRTKLMHRNQHLFVVSGFSDQKNQYVWKCRFTQNELAKHYFNALSCYRSGTFSFLTIQAKTHSMATSSASSWTCLFNYFLLFSAHTALLLSIQFQSELDRLKANIETPLAACLSGSHLSYRGFCRESFHDKWCTIIERTTNNGKKR